MLTCEPKKEQARANNRESFPAVASIMDEFRAEFGAENVRLIYAEEGGNSIGKKPPEPLKFITTEQWLAGSKKIIFEAARREEKKLLPNLNGYVRGARK